MAEFFSHGRIFRNLVRRWGISSFRGGSRSFPEISSWVQPTVTIDRDWDVDDRVIWGYTADAVSIGPPIEAPSVALFVGSRECLVRKITAWALDAVGSALVGAEFNLLTPDATYNPVINGAGEFFPFFQTTRTFGALGAPLSIPLTRVIGGSNGLFSVTIGGVPIAPAIGPRWRAANTLHIPSVSVMTAQTTDLIDWDDPPIILPPFKVLAIQMHNPALGAFLFANVFLSERDAA